MRNPIRSEAEAFSFVLVMCAVFGAVALAGWLGNGWTALAVFLADIPLCKVGASETAGRARASRTTRKGTQIRLVLADTNIRHLVSRPAHPL